MPRALCIPFAPVLGNSQKNRAEIMVLAANIAAADTQPDIVILPELALSGYLMESITSEAALGIEAVHSLAHDLAQTGVSAQTEWIVGLPLREGNDIFNCAFVLRDGKVLHQHRKLFLPTYGMFDEGRYFLKGKIFSLYDGALGKTAILICEDAWHLELAYLASLQSADAVVVISASPARGLQAAASFSSSDHWRQRLQSCAESYGQVFLYCNRSGVEDGVLYDGSNFALNAAADFVASEKSLAYEGACSYFFHEKKNSRAGFGGNSSRHNDASLVQALIG